MDNVNQMVGQLDPYSEEDALATALFADSHQLNFDGDGRVTYQRLFLTMQVLIKA